MHVKRIMFTKPQLLPSSPVVGLQQLDDVDIEITEVGIQIADTLVPMHNIHYISGLPWTNDPAPKTSLQSLPPAPQPAGSKAIKAGNSRSKT